MAGMEKGGGSAGHPENTPWLCSCRLNLSFKKNIFSLLASKTNVW